jgi:prepilin signal peptidase PulO-like enzyme (type II secretory pathway)
MRVLSPGSLRLVEFARVRGSILWIVDTSPPVRGPADGLGFRVELGGVVVAVAGLIATLARWPSLEGAITAAAVSAILLCAAVDLREMRIPNVLTYSGTVVVLACAPIFGLDRLWNALGGAALGGLSIGFMSLISRGQVGLGDAKLSAFGGALVGIAYVLPALLVGSLTALPLSLILMVTRRINRKTLMPFGPFLAFGFVLVVILAGSVFTG